MINGSFLATTFANKAREIGFGPTKVGYDENRPNEVRIFDVYFTFNVGEKAHVPIAQGGGSRRSLEVVIEDKAGSKEFREHILSITDEKFWREHFPSSVVQKKHRSDRYLEDQAIKPSTNGHYEFTAQLTTQNESRAQRAVYNSIMRPVLRFCME